MKSRYRYRDEGGTQLYIDATDEGEILLALGPETANSRPAIQIPVSERIKAAQAIVGKDWNVAPAADAGPTEIEVVVRSGKATTRIVQEIDAAVGNVIAGNRARELGEAMCWFLSPETRDARRDDQE